MDWIRAASQLHGRCKESRKFGNNTYLLRRAHCCEGKEDCFAVRLHSTDVVTFHSDNSITLSDGGWNTCTTSDRINQYFPGRVWMEKQRWFTSFNGKTVAGLGTVDSNGELTGNDPEKERAEIREEINERNRPRNRARYWLNKARGFSVDRSQCVCGKSTFKSTDSGWVSCKSRTGWKRRNMAMHIGETLECGCQVLNKPPVFRGTVQDILKEENQTVRVAMMRCYGIERFFLDANPKIIDERAGYQLLSLDFGRWTNEHVRALKMACTTTGAVYINTVPQDCADVPSALDWMFNTTDYLGTVGQQS